MTIKEDLEIKHVQYSNEVSAKVLLVKCLKLYSYLRSKLLVLLAFILLGGIIGFIYSWEKKPIFIASTTFVLENGDSGDNLGRYAGLASIIGLDIGAGGGGGIFQGDNILELYKSRTMIKKVLLSSININGKKQLLIDRYIEFNDLKSSWDKTSSLKGISFGSKSSLSSLVRLKDSIMSEIVADINKNYLYVAKPDAKLSIIKAEVKAPDEIFAKAFNEEIVENVNEFYVQTKTRKSLENISILQNKTDSVRAVMNGAIYSAATISDKTPNLNPTHQTQRIAPMQKSQFLIEINKAVLGELVKNLELSKMSLLHDMPLIQIIDRPIYPLEKLKLSRLKSIFIGALLAGILTVLFLLIKQSIRNLMA